MTLLDAKILVGKEIRRAMGSRTMWRANHAYLPFIAGACAVRQEKCYHDYVTADGGIAIAAAGIFQFTGSHSSRGRAGRLSPASSASAMTGSDVWRVIRSNLWLIILMLIVSTAAGYGVNYWLNRYHPHYTAEGKVLVLGTGEDTAAGTDARDQLLDVHTLPMEVRRQRAMLKDSLMITEVLQNPNTDVRTTAWYKRFTTHSGCQAGSDRPAGSHVDARFALIHVTMTDSDPNSCKVIVQSLVDQYIKDQQERNRDRQYNLNQDLEQQRSPRKTSSSWSTATSPTSRRS